MYSPSLLRSPLPREPLASGLNVPSFHTAPSGPGLRSMNRKTVVGRHTDAARQMQMADTKFNTKLSGGMGFGKWKSRHRPYRDRDRPIPTSNGFLEVQASPRKGDGGSSYTYSELEEDVSEEVDRCPTPSLSWSRSRTSSASSSWSSSNPHPDDDNSYVQELPYTTPRKQSIQPRSIPLMRFATPSPTDTLQVNHDNTLHPAPLLLDHWSPVQNTLATAICARAALQIMISSRSVNFSDPTHARIAVAYLDVIQPYAKPLDAQRLICDILFYFSASIYEHVQSSFRKGWYMTEGAVGVLELLMDRMQKATGQILDIDHSTLRDLIELDISKGTFFAQDQD